MTESSKEPKAIGDCDVCKRSGLPILPLRYAITRTDGEDVSSYPAGPEVPSSLMDDSLSAIPLPKGQRYTMRLLREGFLYVFDEAHGIWYWYIVTDQGYLLEKARFSQRELKSLDLKKPQTIDSKFEPPENKQEFSCAANAEHTYPGRFITIKDPETATNIYLAFSDVSWTKRVWKEYANNENSRRNSMRKISLKNWKSGKEKYSDKIDNLPQYVSESLRPWRKEYKSDKGNEHTSINSLNSSIFSNECEKIGAWFDGVKTDAIGAYNWWVLNSRLGEGSAFSFSNAPVRGIKEQIDGLIKWSYKITSAIDMKPMMVVLNDPIGITTDLAVLMGARHKEFMNQETVNGKEWRWPIASMSAINSLKSGIGQKAQIDYMHKLAEKELERPRLIQPGTYDKITDKSNEYYDRLEKSKEEGTNFYTDEYNKAFNEIPQKYPSSFIENQADFEWGKYKNRLRDNQPENWIKEVYEPEMNRFNNEILNPLAKTYIAWLISPIMLVQFESHFDDKNAESGGAFVDILTMCIQDTQKYPYIFNKYEQLINADKIERSNLPLRGLLLNLSEVIDSVNKQPEITLDNIGSLPWGGLLQGYQALTKEFADAKAAPGRLLGALMAPVLKKLDRNKVRPILIALGIIANKELGVVKFRGKFWDAVDAFIDDIEKVNPDVFRGTKKRDLKALLRIKINKNNAVKTTAGGPQDLEVNIIYDKEVIEEIKYPGSAKKKAAGAIVDTLEWKKDYGSIWTQLSDRESQLGMVGVLLTSWALLIQGKTLDEAVTVNDKIDSYGRFTGLAISGVGGVADTGYAILKHSSKVGGRLAAAAGDRWISGLKTGGRLFGFVGAVVLAGIDVFDGVKNMLKGQYLLAFSYFTSAVAGFGSFVFLVILSSTGIGLALAAIAIMANVIIGLLSNNPLQEWIENCYFGDNDTSERYKSLNAENLALENLND